MTVTALSPLAHPPIPAWVAALPKADLHVHAEGEARLERVLARERGQPPLDRRRWAAHLLTAIPAGMPRLLALGDDRRFDRATVDALDAIPEYFVARVADLLAEAAADGAVLIEVTFGAATILLPEFMELFREAERRVRARYPALHAEAIIAGTRPNGDTWREVQLPACIAAAREGLGGIHILPDPYDAEMDWAPVYEWAELAADAGLGIAAHAGEFSGANLAAALRTPGLTRLGHAVYAARDPRLVEQIARSGITVECSLSCNVVLGAVDSYESHPIRQFVAAGVPVTLSTDDPVRVATTIGREYAVAAALGFGERELLGFTRNGVRASFAEPGRRDALLAGLMPRGGAREQHA
jgi:adenosine deaminase